MTEEGVPVLLDLVAAGCKVKATGFGGLPGKALDVGDELAENSGITWDEATFREYIKDPKAKVPGTKMIFPGPERRQAH
jgi:hypothetical protein